MRSTPPSGEALRAGASMAASGGGGGGGGLEGRRVWSADWVIDRGPGFWRRYEMDERPTYDSFRKRTPPVTFSGAAMERRAFITKSKRISNGSLNKNTLKLNMRYEKKIYQSKLLDCVL